MSNDTQAEKVGNPKKCEICKRAETNKQTNKQCDEIEPNPSEHRAMHKGDNPSFRDEFIKCNFLLTIQFIFVF
jgi:hypothetical protein